MTAAHGFPTIVPTDKEGAVMAKGIRVAVAGMRFGAAFVPIHKHHPDVRQVGIIEPDAAVRAEID